MGLDAEPPVSLLPGSTLADVIAREHDWVFIFENGVSVVAESHWRLADADRVLVTDEDHDQWFGLPQPMDAALVVREKLDGARTQTVALSDRSDLLLQFTNGHCLELMIASAGYENWHVHGPDGSHTFAIGGGELRHVGVGDQ
jgi:hypothetical protein